MRFLVILASVLVVAGCAGNKSAQSQDTGHAGGQGTGSPKQKLIVAPDATLAGKVVGVNTAGRFVVLNFPLGRLPVLDQRMNLYRGGLKVGEVKVTGPQDDDNIVADLVTGDSEIGDQVRND
jgi:hypothetical protein